MESQANKRRLLYVITQGEWGGAQRYVYDLAINSEEDFEVFIAVGEKDGRKDLQSKILNSKPETLNKSKTQIIQLKHLVRKISPVHDILAIFELARLYKTLKPDIIHLNSSKAGILGSFARLLKIKNYKLEIVYTVHGWVFNEPNRKLGRWLYKFLEKLTARWKDRIIVLSPQDFADGKKLGIPETKLIEIPLGIERPKFLRKEDAREQIVKLLNCKIANDDNVWIGTIANLYPAKGIDVLIEAVKNVANVKIVKDVKFIVIGEGPERDKLESLIKKNRLENIIFLAGFLKNASQYLTAFDAFVLPSRKEGMPYTILEATCAGLPIIASTVGGIPSLAEDNHNIHLFSPEDSNELSEKIIHLINSSPKPSGDTTASATSLQTMVAKTFRLYLSII